MALGGEVPPTGGTEDGFDESDLPFFRRQPTRDAISRLSAASSLTIIVGAGSSHEVGFPLWDELVRRLLARVASETDLDDVPDGELCRLAVERDGLLGAATIARSALGSDFIPVMREALVEDVPDDVRPGATAQAVARLVKVWGAAQCYVLTTNYDLTLEMAIKEETGTESVERRLEDVTGDVEGVFYLHGLLTEDEEQGVVLSESDFHGENHRWQESLVSRRFRDRDSHTVFVGTSLSDPNLLGYLIRNQHETGRVLAVLVRPEVEDAAPDIPRPLSPLEIAYEEISEHRWRALGVTALRADYPSQAAQFLAEVARARACRDAGAPYNSYGQRLNEWFAGFKEVTLGLVGQQAFVDRQEQLHAYAARWVDQILDLVRQTVDVPEDELLAVQVWSRMPEQRSMAMTISSDRSWRRSRAVDRRRIMLPTQRTAIEAFCYGTERVHNTGDRSRQWNYVQAWPVVLDDDHRGRLPVGAVALLSTAPQETSVLSALPMDHADAIRSFLVGSAAELLDPDPHPVDESEGAA